MDHIERHLDQPLDLETLAAVAHFSAFHFHRLFRAWTGETLGDHLRRRRVEKGALRLLTQPGSSVLEVALAVGFGSGEAFARAFKSRFGATPSAWREERNSDQAEAQPGSGRAQPRSGARRRRLRSWVPRNSRDRGHDHEHRRHADRPAAHADRLLPPDRSLRAAGGALLDGATGAVDGRERPVRPRALRHRPRRPDDHRAGEVPLRRRRRGRARGGDFRPAAAHRPARRPLRLHAASKARSTTSTPPGSD